MGQDPTGAPEQEATPEQAPPAEIAGGALPDDAKVVRPRDPDAFRRPRAPELATEEPGEPESEGRDDAKEKRRVRALRDKLKGATSFEDVWRVVQAEAVKRNLVALAAAPGPQNVPPAEAVVVIDPPANVPAAATPEKPPEPDKIMGVLADEVAAYAELAAGVVGKAADAAEGTPLAFRGDREMVFFPGTKFERVVKANLERDLAQTGAILLGKRYPIMGTGGGEPNPEAKMGVTLALIAAPVVIPLTTDYVIPFVRGAAAKVVEWWRSRRARAEAAEGGGHLRAVP